MTAVRGRLAGLLVLALVIGVIVAIVHANQASAHHSQEIANCVVVLHETWTYCSKLHP